MIWLQRWWRVVALGVLTTSSAWAVTTESAPPDRDYRVIIDRNAFGLKPPPPPATNSAAAAAPKDEILLTGIKSLGGLRAYFMTKAPAGKNPEFYSLAPDEKKNGLEVLEINIADRSVRVRNSGVESVMTFASNGVKPPTNAPSAMPAPPVPGTPPTTIAGAGVNPAVRPGTSAGAASSYIRNVPSRIPNRGTGTMGGGMPTTSVNQPASPPNPYAAEQDVLLMELQKRANPNVVFPPTPGLPGGAGPGLPGGGPPGLPGR